jgi:hypothetical protein
MKNLGGDPALVAAEFVRQCAATARRNQFACNVVGAEMLKHGYALMTGADLEVADRAVRTMLKLYDEAFVLSAPPAPGEKFQ